MLDKIKKFVKYVPSTVWVVVCIGLFALAVIWAANNQPKKHHKHGDHKPAAVEAPAAK